MLRHARGETDEEGAREKNIRDLPFGRLREKPARKGDKQAYGNEGYESYRADNVGFHWFASCLLCARPSCTDPPRQFRFQPKEVETSVPGSSLQSPRVYPSTER